jgi:hypothetical protein
MGDRRTTVTKVAHPALMRLDDQDVFDALRQIPGRIDAQVFFRMARTDDLDHCFRHTFPRFIDVGRFNAEDGNIGTAIRPVGEDQRNISEMITSAFVCPPGNRSDRCTNAINDLLMPYTGEQTPGLVRRRLLPA